MALRDQTSRPSVPLGLPLPHLRLVQLLVPQDDDLLPLRGPGPLDSYWGNDMSPADDFFTE